MPLAGGTRLGPYEIVGPIGAGGMGEVYRARDTRLGRSVAVKVLPEHLSASPELRQRFEREARAISSLSHPNICALFDVGREGDIEYLVMELLEGEPLADRLHRGPLPLPDFLRVAREIASALERAHRSGIIHRDLKPGNIILTKGGAKLVDFGLARSRTTGPEVSPDTATVRVASLGPLTSEGSIVGTVPYMAPEQLEGKPADARSDIFSFGAVMYEMATGRRAFRGENPAALIASIMTVQPEFVRDGRGEVPAALERVISIAMRKDPDERWQSAHDIALQLEDAATVSRAPGTTGRRSRIVALAATAGVAALVAAIATYVLTRPSATPAPVLHADLVAADDAIALLSPAGDQVTFATMTEEGLKLVVRSLRTGTVRIVDGLGADVKKGFSARDGRSFYYGADGKLLRRTIDATTSVVLAELPALTGGCEEEDGTLLLAGSFGTPILALAGDDKPLTPVTEEPRTHGESLAGSPVCLPGTARFLYLARVAAGVNSKVYFAGAGAPRKPLLDADALVGYSRDHVLFVRSSGLYAQRLDITAEQVEGPVLRVVDHVDYMSGDALAFVSLSTAGALTYLDSPPEKAQFSQFSLENRKLRDIGEPVAVAREFPSLPKRCILSPDRLRFACRVTSATTGGTDIWVIDVASSVSTPLTSDPAPKMWPTWDRNNRTVYYVADRHGFFDIYAREFDSAAPEREVVRSDRDKVPLLSPEPGKLWWRQVPEPAGVLYEMASDGQTRELEKRGLLRYGVLAPDRQFVAFHSDDLGQHKVLAGTFPDIDRRRIVFPRDAVLPAFGPDSRRLFFWDTEERALHHVTVGMQGDEILVSEPTRTQVTSGERDVIVGVTADGDVILGKALPVERRPTRYVSDWTALIAQQ